jgi:hypothetical protein
MKMKNINDKEKLRILLREYIENVLLMEDGDGGGDYDLSIGGGGGGSGGGWDKLFGSILNVGSVAIGKSKELLQNLKTAFAVSIDWVFSSLVPFFDAEYDKIFEDHRTKLNEIKQRYDSVYKRSSEVLKGGDAQLVMFMVNPTAFLTGPILEKTPDAAIDALDVITGGNIPPKKLKRAKELASSFAVATAAGAAYQNSSFKRNDNLLLKEEKSKKVNKEEKLREFIKQAIQAYIEPEFKNASADTNKVLKSLGQQVTKMIDGVTLEKLPPQVRSKFKVKEEEVKKVAEKQKKDPEEVKKEMLDAFLAGVKQKALLYYKQKMGKDFNAAKKGS